VQDDAVNVARDRLALGVALYIFFALLGCSCSVIASFYVFDGLAIIGFLVAFLPFLLLGIVVARVGRVDSLPEVDQTWLRRLGVWAVRSIGILLAVVLFVVVFLHEEVDRAFSLISLSTICLLWLVGVLMGGMVIAFGGHLRAITWRS